MQMFLTVIYKSLTSLSAILTTILILITAASSIIYMVERNVSDSVYQEASSTFAHGNPYTSIPMTMYFAFTTVTCVGYGDVYPVSAGGKIATCGLVLLGSVIITVPLSVLSTHFQHESRMMESRQDSALKIEAAATKVLEKLVNSIKASRPALSRRWVPSSMYQSTSTTPVSPSRLTKNRNSHASSASSSALLAPPNGDDIALPDAGAQSSTLEGGHNCDDVKEMPQSWAAQHGMHTSSGGMATRVRRRSLRTGGLSIEPAQQSRRTSSWRGSTRSSLFDEKLSTLDADTIKALEALDDFEERMHERLDLFIMAIMEMNSKLAQCHALSAQTHLAPSLFD